MHWRPVPPPPVDNQLGTDLMFKLESYLFDDHWEYNSGYEISYDDHRLLAFIQGLAACGVDDADELIKLVAEHKKIVIWAGDEDGPR
jgi:hypothetical protein